MPNFDTFSLNNENGWNSFQDILERYPNIHIKFCFTVWQVKIWAAISLFFTPC